LGALHISWKKQIADQAIAKMRSGKSKRDSSPFVSQDASARRTTQRRSKTEFLRRRRVCAIVFKKVPEMDPREQMRSLAKNGRSPGRRSVSTTAPVATADATAARPCHAGISAEPSLHQIVEGTRPNDSRTIVSCRP